jgi:predicted small secreted protein
MSRKLTSPLVALAALMGAVSVGACNTVEGVGEDVQSAGEAIEESADDVGETEDPTP